VEVRVGTDLFHLFLVEILDEKLHLQKNVKLAFKETEVILSKGVITSSANVAEATIKKIEKGVVLTDVTLLYGTIEIKALVATLMFEALHVSLGDTIFWMLQPSEISLLWSTNYGI
jgi:molybdopterin-binding protein